MALFLIMINIIILISCAMLHYNRHFQFQRKLMSQDQQRECCYGVFISLETEHNLYPQLFIYYILFLILLAITIIIKSSSNEQKNDVSDWIIIYGVLIACCTEPFFSFYQYIKIINPNSNTSINSTKQWAFIAFSFIFSLFYVFQIHFFPWLWPTISIMLCTFNIVCTLKVSAHLIRKYATLNYDSVLSTVYLMRRSLIICTLLQTLYLSLFLGSNHRNTITQYLPSFWCISIVLLSINFIKNRQFLQQNFFKIYQCCILKKYWISRVLLICSIKNMDCILMHSND